MTYQYQESLDIDALTRHQAKLTLLGLYITLFVQIPSYIQVIHNSSEIKQLLKARCFFETFHLYRELHFNYSVIYLIYIFRYDLSIQIVCRCVDG